MNFHMLRVGPTRIPRRRKKTAGVLRYLGLWASTVWLTACTSTVTIPLAGIDHPANPDAQEAPAPPRSTALEAEVIAAPQPAAQGHGMHQHHHH